MEVSDLRCELARKPSYSRIEFDRMTSAEIRERYGLPDIAALDAGDDD